MTKRRVCRRFKSHPEIISLAVMLYIRFSVSPGDVEDLRHQEGINVRHETRRYQWHGIGPEFASDVQKRRNWEPKYCPGSGTSTRYS